MEKTVLRRRKNTAFDLTTLKTENSPNEKHLVVPEAYILHRTLRDANKRSYLPITFVVAEWRPRRVRDDALPGRHEAALHPGGSDAALPPVDDGGGLADRLHVRRGLVVGRGREYRETVVRRGRPRVQFGIRGRGKGHTLRLEVTLERDGHDGGIGGGGCLGLDEGAAGCEGGGFLLVDWGVVASGGGLLRGGRGAGRGGRRSSEWRTFCGGTIRKPERNR